MNESSRSPSPPAESPAPGVPLDLKFFYGFVAALILGAIALVVLWRPQSAADSPTSSSGQPRQLAAFALTNQLGQPTGSATVAGKFLVVNFIHTGCSISCLQVNEQMGQVQRLTTGQDDVRLLSFTVDPGTDTPPVLAKFGEQFGADAERWSLLTGPKPELYALIETSFLTRDRTSRGNLMPGGFQDTDRIAVVDRTGRVRRYFDGLRPETPATIVKFLSELRNETK